MNPLPNYITAPLIGAFIGYLTNDIAIRMLFRPLKPWRFLGMRLPLTPGVIPAKRHKLAKNIGEMVGEHLLTGEDIARALQDARFQEDLRQLIESRLAAILDKDLGPAASLLPARFSAHFKVGVKILRWRFLKHLHAHLESDNFSAAASTAVRNHLQELLGRNLDECLSRQDVERFAAVLEAGLGKFLASTGVQDWIRTTAQQQLETFIENGGSLGDLLPQKLIDSLLLHLEKEKIAELSATPLSQLLAKADPEKILQARVWLADRIIETMKNPSTAAAISNLLRNGLYPRTNRPLQEVIEELFGKDLLTRGKNWTAAEFVTLARSAKVKRLLDTVVIELVEQKLLAGPLGKLSAFLPKEVQEGIADFLLQQVNALLVKEVPGLVDSLNIRAIVSRKVDSLDLLRLEGLLLGIMQDQFKYINLFGALLGFLIGLCNVIFLGGI